MHQQSLFTTTRINSFYKLNFTPTRTENIKSSGVIVLTGVVGSDTCIIAGISGGHRWNGQEVRTISHFGCLNIQMSKQRFIIEQPLYFDR